ncbi:hypothetical protein TNCV_1388531 [Trichonephila clavipes]|nr:hypothetical protein TNCV_1388531 [Trichonephila clavipes]
MQHQGEEVRVDHLAKPLAELGQKTHGFSRHPLVIFSLIERKVEGVRKNGELKGKLKGPYIHHCWVYILPAGEDGADLI